MPAKMNNLIVVSRRFSIKKIVLGLPDQHSLGKKLINFVRVQSQTANMGRPKVYLTGKINDEAIKTVQESCDVTMWTGSGPVPRDVLIQSVKGVDGIFCKLTEKIDEEVLVAAGPQLRVIATMSVGFDHLSLPDIKKRHIKVGYTPNVLSDATAELTVALLLATSRRLIEANHEARTGGWTSWSPFWMCGPGLSGATVGILGLGNIGLATAKRLKPFNVKRILYHNRSEKSGAAEIGAELTSFDKLLQESDFVIATCALTPETKKMFNAGAFAKMKKSAIFVNTSRGDVVDQDALIQALENKTIAAAGLDVTSPEPLPLDSPLFKMKNCVVLPHIGSATTETRNCMAHLTAENILTALKNEKMPSELVI